MTAASTITTTTRTAAGVRIRYAEGGLSDGETVLMLNPWPESLYAWETLWPRITAAAPVVAIDLPGFGHSEHRDALMSPRAMGDFLVALIDEWGLDRPHVVGPDVGTGATLFAASVAPDRLRSAVVGSGGTAWPLQVAGALKDILDAPDLDALRATEGRDIVAGALTGIEHHALSETAREDYLSAYAGQRFADSATYVRSYPTDLPVLADRLAEIRTPVQIIAGLHDAFVPPVNGEFLHERLPHSELALFDTGHYTWEDGAEEYGDLLLSWIGGRYLRQTAKRSQA